MDKLDNHIIEELEKNSRVPNQDIANRLNVTEGTIRHRISKLVEEGIIEKFTIRCKDKTTSIILIKLDTSVRTAEFVKILKKIDNISSVYHVTGEDSVICYVETKDNDQLDNVVEEIRAQSGVLRTKTVNVLKKY